ncbi:HNH endonuclease signature motif containing protein [uncultured Corynebacterium sp.]|uniref:HNH endonuclease signature motif containing protein n=1 Tax=uncultured Corynebacterium sp. TaxID=159447 RepID=UPI0025CBA0B8|nr:HNH endonuclease signature motif containing protein [uncultured Corynebacterium sp.]
MAHAEPTEPTEPDDEDRSDDCGDDTDPFEFPDTRYAHENRDDPLCAMGLDRNRRDLQIAELTCPDDLADVEHHLAGLAPRLGITYGAALDYCDVGIALERLPALAELLEDRPFLPWSHLKLIARAVCCLSDEHLGAFCDDLLRYLAPKKSNQVLVGFKSLHKQLAHIIELLQPEVRPKDLPDDDEPSPPAEDPSFSVDERSATHTRFTVSMRADQGREFIDSLDAIARAHDVARTEALMLLLRSTSKVEVVFNLYREFDGDRAWMSGPGWLSGIATEEWTKRITHVRLASNGSTEGYVPTEAMRAFIEGRDGVCRFPGCSHPAHKDDGDHVCTYNKENPAAGGPTITGNVHCLCRRHHNLKTSKLWDVDAHPDGTEVWTSRDGAHEFVTVPEGPLAGFGRQTFDARLTRKTAVLKEHNRLRMEAEEEARRITREALAAREAEMDAAYEMREDLFGPDGTHPDAGLSYEEKRDKYPDVPPF